ncbi:hypothetical protein F2Q69_00046825 [Brassica cretica]|uniref:Uncharacterized protein n=1 Tax=Brassica cretica TaxID=69181 RepID=A0A8S9PT00_BRACR|nr:hypothetical protein F2Q69_00046825 [Brassica cretica]
MNNNLCFDFCGPGSMSGGVQWRCSFAVLLSLVFKRTGFYYDLGTRYPSFGGADSYNGGHPTRNVFTIMESEYDDRFMCLSLSTEEYMAKDYSKTCYLLQRECLDRIVM